MAKYKQNNQICYQKMFLTFCKSTTNYEKSCNILNILMLFSKMLGYVTGKRDENAD